MIATQGRNGPIKLDCKGSGSLPADGARPRLYPSLTWKPRSPLSRTKRHNRTEDKRGPRVGQSKGQEDAGFLVMSN